MSILRNTLRALCFAVVLAPSAVAAQGLRVMPYGGFTPMNAAGGGQVEAGITKNLSVFADYNRWGAQFICGGPATVGEEDRCGQQGWMLHGGATLHLRDASARWRPYVSAGAGTARVIEAGESVGRALPSFSGESGFDWGGNRKLGVRLGLRWQGRPEIGKDYFGPVVGVRLRLR